MLLDHFAAAAICGIAYRDAETPRTVLEHLLRRSVSDAEWESDYATLLPAPG